MVKINYRIKIIPNKAKFEKLFLWLPLPYELDANKTIINLQPTKISQENKFGNQMAYFEVKREEIKRDLVIEEKFELEKTDKKTKLFEFTENDFKNDDCYQKYLAPDFYVQSNSLVIQTVAKKIKSERENLLLVIKDVYDYILSILTYGFPTFGLYTSLQAFDFRQVDCGGFSTLFCALCQAVGVPARVIAGFLAKNAKNSGYHAWSEFMLPSGQWVPVDLAMTKLKMRDYFGRLYEPRIVFCRGTDFSLIPQLPNKEKASILQIYYLRLNEGAEIRDLKVKTEIKVGFSS